MFQHAAEIPPFLSLSELYVMDFNLFIFSWTLVYCEYDYKHYEISLQDPSFYSLSRSEFTGFRGKSVFEFEEPAFQPVVCWAPFPPHCYFLVLFVVVLDIAFPGCVKCFTLVLMSSSLKTLSVFF